MRKKIGTSLLKPKKAVCAERLHEALKGAKVKNFVEAGGDFHAGAACNQFVKLKEQATLSTGQLDIGVVQKRGDVIMRQAWPHALKIYQPCGVVVDENVLRLKVTVNKHSRQRSEACGDAMHHGQFRIPPHGRLIQTKMRAQAVVEKILLLPKIELFAELALEPQAGTLKALGGGDMQFADFKERGLVE